MRAFAKALSAVALVLASPVVAQSIFEATLGEAKQDTPEISTAQLREMLRDGAVLLDARPPLEYAISHIPGALNVAPKPDRPAHQYVSDVAEVGRLLGGAKDSPLVLYCNGPFCGKVKRLGAEMVKAGYTNVSRYQLGAPGWRAIAGAMETELGALSYLAKDKTAVWVDARDSSAFSAKTLQGARNIPAAELKPGKDQGVLKAAKDDGRLPMDDHNTRIIVFGAHEKDARAVADAIASEAFHNVSFVSEPYETIVHHFPQQHAGPHGSSGAPKITPIIRTSRTISDQPLRLPQGESEIVASAVDIPAGGSLPIHLHPWSRFVYVERGRLRVINHDTGSSKEFDAGQVLPEVVAQWHEARSHGGEPVRLIVIDLVPPGVNNTIMKQ